MKETIKIQELINDLKYLVDGLNEENVEEMLDSILLVSKYAKQSFSNHSIIKEDTNTNEISGFSIVDNARKIEKLIKDINGQSYYEN